MMLFSYFKNKMFSVILMSVVVFGLVACGQADHEPLPGEYGEQLVNSLRLTDSEIQALNTAVVTQPRSDSMDRPRVGIGFQGQGQKNPYRFVIVAKGAAIHEGEVDLKWIGGIESEASNGYRPEIFQDDDSRNYSVNEPVLLVISSDPFSVGEKNKELSYFAQAELMKASNLQFQTVELQVWQGKGSKYNWTAYLSFLVILMMAIFGVYRVVSR